MLRRNIRRTILYGLVLHIVRYQGRMREPRAGASLRERQGT